MGVAVYSNVSADHFHNLTDLQYLAMGRVCHVNILVSNPFIFLLLDCMTNNVSNYCYDGHDLRQILVILKVSSNWQCLA